jgi:hypothetical protein
MKENVSFFFLVAVLFSLVLFTNLSAENPLPQGLSDLLSGKTTDTQGVLSGLDDTQIPEAITLCDVLRHKALHKEIKLTPEAVDLFKTTLETRLKSSEWVSLAKTPTHIHRVPARGITVEGHKLTIPEHFLAPVRFVVSEFSPQGEAGTLLPDIRVLFIGGTPPVTAKILLDGKEIPGQGIKSGFLYRPTLHSISALSIGSHRVEAILTDASKEVASASWSFTVGEKPVSSPIIPGDAAMIGSFSVSVSTLIPGSSLSGSVEVIVFEGPDGKRLLEYRLSDGSDQETFGVKTTSLFFLNRIIRNPKRREVLRILPKSGAVFTGRETLFSSVYSGEGTVTKFSWLVQEPLGSASGSFETPAISWEVKKWSHVTLKVVVEFLVDDTVSQATFEQHKDVTALDVSTSIGSSRFASYETSASGTVAVSGERLIRDLYSQKSHALREGETFPFPSGSPGKVSVTRSRWKLAGGTAEAKFVDATASATNLLFSSFGFVEFVHDVAIAYEWEDEHHEMEFSPKESFLYGRFFYKASSEFTQFPPGIIFGTDRYLSFKTIHLEINGEKRLITNQPAGYCPVEPPIRLAWSDLFPHAKPIVVNAMLPIAIRKTPTSYAYLPNPSNFRILLKYDKPEQAINKEIPCRVYFVTGNVGKSDHLMNRDEWSNFFGYARPLTDWLSVKTYPSPADLVQVEIDPEAPEVFEGQDIKFSAKITPKEGFGTGEFTETTKTLDLLDGYQAQTLTNLDWKALLLPPQTPVKQGQNWEFAFQPKEGTGTYEVIASTVVEVKEKDTKTSAKVAGVGSTTAIVMLGLKILSPIDRFAYPESTAIQVITSMDNTQEEWEKIGWSIDGKPWNHGVIAPPLLLTPDKPGKFVLKAVYNQPPKPPLTAIAPFEVKPVSISILPWRRVTEFVASSPVSMRVNAVLNQQTVTKPGVWFKWSDDGSVQAQIEKVEWQAFFNSSGSSELKPLPNTLEAEAFFGSFGAVTALATVTLQVRGKTGVPLTYSFGANRGDLWVIPKASEYEIKGHFPDFALAEAGRTYVATYAWFDFAGNSYTWSPEEFPKEIALSPGLPGVPNAISKTMVLKWKGPTGESSEGTSHVMAPIVPGNYHVQLQLEADFGNSNLVPIIKGDWPVQVFPVSKYIAPSVNPASISIPVGDSQFPVKFSVSPIKKRPEDFLICNDSFKVAVQPDVEWFKGETPYKKGNPISFEGDQISSGTLSGNGSVFFQETFSPHAPGGIASMTAKAKFEVNPPPLTHIVVRREASDEVSNHYEVGFRKETNLFKAIGFSGESEIGLIDADWKMMGGEATTTLQIAILKTQQVPEPCRIATINKDYSATGSKIAMVSYLPGTFTLDVSKGDVSTTVSFRVKQPTVNLSIKAVDGVGPLTQLPLWISETQDIWLQGNNFLNVKIRHGESEGESFPWVENASFSNPDPFSAEPQFSLQMEGLWVITPLVFDAVFNSQYNGKWVVPRLSRELLSRKRSLSLSSGSERDINVFIIRQLYTAPSPDPGLFFKFGGYAISQDEYFNPDNSQKINDFASSGLILSHATTQSFDRYPQDLAHEIGHLVIQIGLYNFIDTGLDLPTTDEHVASPTNLMVPGTKHGRLITASQALMILDYKKKKPETSYFIREE